MDHPEAMLAGIVENLVIGNPSVAPEDAQDLVRMIASVDGEVTMVAQESSEKVCALFVANMAT